MRCTQCGFPLSPSRSQCPRCGAPSGKATGKPRQTRAASQPSYNTAAPEGQPWGAPQPFTAPIAEPQWHVPSSPMPAAPPWAPQPQPQLQPQPQQAPQAMPPYQGMEYRTSTPITAYKMPGNPSRPPRTKLGFTIAGTCIAMGALILMLVYSMAQNLTSTPTTTDITTNTTTVQHTPVPTHTAIAHKATATSKPTVVSTARPTNQQYINDVQLATSVNTTTGKPVSLSNIFHVGQPVYVALTLHPSAYNGAVCLTWTVNKQAIPYNTAIGNSTLLQMNAYFFFKPGTAGQGSVDVAWANTTSCANAVAVQHLNFTVEP